MERTLTHLIFGSVAMLPAYTLAEPPSFKYEPVGFANQQYSTYGRALSESGLVGYLQEDAGNNIDALGIYESPTSERILESNSNIWLDLHVVRDDWVAGGNIGSSATIWDADGASSTIVGGSVLDFDAQGRAISSEVFRSGGRWTYPIIVNDDGTTENMVDPVEGEHFLFADINDNGIAAIRCAEDLYKFSTLCYWTEGEGMTDLGVVINYEALPYAINNNNQVVGYTSSDRKAFIYDLDTLSRTFIDVLGSQGRDISDDGYVVGKYLYQGIKHGFLYVDETYFNLNDLVVNLPVDHDSVNIIEAVKINNNHDIVANVEICDAGNCYIQAARLTEFVPADVDLALSADNDGDIREGEYGYIELTVSNLPGSPARDVRVDIVSADIYGVMSVAGSCTNDISNATCTFDNIPGGQSELISLTVMPGLGEHTTTANVSTLDNDTVTANDAAATTLSVDYAVDLQAAVSKKGRGRWTDVEFTWSGASGNVDLFKDGAVIFSGGNSGTYEDRYDQVHEWQACLAGNPDLCSESLILDEL